MSFTLPRSELGGRIARGDVKDIYIILIFHKTPRYYGRMDLAFDCTARDFRQAGLRFDPTPLTPGATARILGP
jgi:hypothetical protein